MLRQAVRGAARLMLWLVLAAMLSPLILMAAAMVQAAELQPPPGAQRHELTLRREAQRVWGLQAPVATFAAQLQQESRWREDARSPVGAQGLAQFMPATARWVGTLDPELQHPAPANATWAMRALVTYDHWLHQRVKADNACERMAFTLSAYNGGLGWVYKRQRLSSQPGLCFGATCTINPGITPASQRENEGYPVLILQRYEPLYLGWGVGSCR